MDNGQLPEGKYAKVEMMGHRLLWGRISEVEIAGAKMLKVEPIVGGKIVGETMVNAASLYALTPCAAAQAFANAPSKPGYGNDVLQLLAAPSSAGIADSTRDYDDAPDDESDLPCSDCNLVGGMHKIDCPNYRSPPKDPNTPDMFSVAGAPPVERIQVNEARWRKVEDQPVPTGAVFELKREGNVERDLQWENGCIFNHVRRAQLLILLKGTDEWRYQIDGEPEDLVQAIPPRPAPAETIVAIGTKVIVKGDYEAKEPDLHGVITRGPIDGMYEVECFLPNEDGGDTEMQLVAPERLQVKDMPAVSFAMIDKAAAGEGWRFFRDEQPPQRVDTDSNETIEVRRGTDHMPGFVFWGNSDWLVAGGGADWLTANGCTIGADTVTVCVFNKDLEWRIEGDR